MRSAQSSDLLDRLDENEIVDICRTLVRYKTVNPPGDELPAAEYVARLLGEAGFETELVPLSDTRASLIARLKGKGEVAALFFNGHLDVVPPGTDTWLHEPFEAELADGQLWGRGSADMKGGLAAMLVAARLAGQASLPLRGDLIVTATANEEVTMTGAKQIATRFEPGSLQAAIVAEPTNNEIGLAERGVLWLELETLGKAAHGSTPHLGQNAISMMLQWLAEVEGAEIPYAPHPILGNFTLSINTIAGGLKTNVVPDRCTATVDMRTVPGQDNQAIIHQFEHLAKAVQERQPAFRGSVKVTNELPPAETDSNEPVVRAFMEAHKQASRREPAITQVRFATEAGVYAPKLGVPTIICGPGDPALAHQPNEHVEIRQLVEAARIYTAAIVKLLVG